MIAGYRRQRATASIGEYVLTFSLVVAVGAATAVYVQRALQARAHDARQYMMTNLKEECANTNCVGNGQITEQYEPYYTQVDANVQANSIIHKGLAAKTQQAPGRALFRANINNQSNATSTQLPPANAVADQGQGEE